MPEKQPIPDSQEKDDVESAQKSKEVIPVLVRGKLDTPEASDSEQSFVIEELSEQNSFQVDSKPINR